MAEALGARQTDGPRTTHHRSHDLSARLRRPHDDTEVDGQMMDALYSAATGMMAQQTSMDVVANNLANATTTGYKRDRLDLVDLAYQPFQLPTGKTGQIGLGAAPGQVAKEHEQGDLQNTGRALDVAIQGEGFIQVTRPDGTLAYTRAGNLQIDANGRLGMPGGELLQPRDHVPAGASDVTIGADGTRHAPRSTARSRARPDHHRLVRQPVRPPGPRRQPVHAHGQLGRADVGTPGTGQPRPALRGRARGLERERGHGDDLPRHHAARLRGRQQGGQASDEMMGMANGLRR